MTPFRGGVLTGTERTADGRLRSFLVGLAVLVAALVSGVRFGTPGVVVGVVLVGAWLAVPPVVVLALGQVLFAALLPADASLAAVVVVEAPLALLFLAAVLDVRAPGRTLGVGLVSLTALCGLVVVGFSRFDALWQVAVLLGCLVAVVGYGLHRYTVVALEGPHGV